MPIAEQLFHEYFRAATEGEECEQFLAIEILEQVQHDSKIRVSDCNIIQFGRILQKNRVPSVHTKRGNVYRVVRIKAKENKYMCVPTVTGDRSVTDGLRPITSIHY